MHMQTSPPDQELIPERYVRLLVWVGAVLLGLLIPLKILSVGYIPSDDAMCHVAKALSGKAWSEILVIRDGFAEDEHPGWHAILGVVHRWTNWDADTLLSFSVVAPFLLFWLALVLPRKRPEAMLLALFLASVAAPGTFVRPLFGRPFIFILIVYVILLQLWARREKISAAVMALSVGLIGVSVWVHGSWYLFGIVIAAFALAGEWRKSFTLAVCWLAGVVLGATFTGHPLDYLKETTMHLFITFGGQLLDRMLVTELKPDFGDLTLVMAVLLALVWRVARGAWQPSVVQNPIFMLAVLGWLLGLKVSRFWTDWGFPAALLWLALDLETILETHLDYRKISALLLAGFAGFGVFFSTTRDLGSRWTSNLTVEYLTPETPGIAGWLPEKGGTVYCSDMWVFFRTFYRNPHAEWRYILGFEPGIMPPEDLAILRKIQWNYFAAAAYDPWVKKMRREDRLILLQGGQPDIAGLEWHYGATGTWIGRLPRKVSQTETKP